MRTDTMEAFLINKASATRSAVSASMELLPLCNMNCEMCFVRLSRGEMDAQGRLRTLDEWKQIADQMANAGVIFLMLTGGEPLLYPDFRELYVYLRKLGMIVTINTNGTLIDAEWIEFFKKYPPRRFNITLYGMSADTYGKICHYPDGCERATKAICALRKAGMDVKINGSLVKANQHEAEQMLAFAHKHDCAINIDTHMQPAVRERCKPYNYQARLTPEEAAESSNAIMRLEHTPEEYEEYRLRKLEEVRKCREMQPEECRQLGVECQAGHTSFVVNWKGRMMPCVMLSTIQIDFLENGYEKCWAYIKEQCDRIQRNPKCFSCELRELCGTCPACGLHEGGAYDALPEYLCRMAQKEYRLLNETRT